jgi:hypothetical protein
LGISELVDRLHRVAEDPETSSSNAQFHHQFVLLRTRILMLIQNDYGIVGRQPPRY